MTDPAPKASYTENQFAEDSEGLVASGRYRLNRLRRWLKPTTRVLDIGCSTGFSVEEALRYGVAESIGIELCLASAEAGRRLGRDIRSQVLPECNFDDVYFDIVQAHHTLEHIPDLREAIREIGRITKPGGILYITEPVYTSLFARDVNWAGWFPQEHFWHFSKATLFRLLSSFGFEPLSYNFPKQSHFITKRGPLYPAKRVFKLMVKHLGLGDTIDVIFMKK